MVGLVVGCSVELRGLKDLCKTLNFETLLQREFQKTRYIVASTEDFNTSHKILSTEILQKSK